MTPVLAIVFDYDGTLVHSNEIKRQAYRPLFPEGERYDRLLQTALKANPTGSRFDVIRNVILLAGAHEQGECEDIVQHLAQEYDLVATEGAATCRERAGVSEELAILAEMYPLYLLSATLETSLLRIVKRRGWERYFRNVRGFPCDKADELIAIADVEGIPVDAVLMVGDGEMDREAALKAGTQFLFMSPETPISRVWQYISGAGR